MKSSCMACAPGFGLVQEIREGIPRGVAVDSQTGEPGDRIGDEAGLGLLAVGDKPAKEASVIWPLPWDVIAMCGSAGRGILPIGSVGMVTGKPLNDAVVRRKGLP